MAQAEAPGLEAALRDLDKPWTMIGSTTDWPVE
jgi:hypothetical protein